MSVPNITKSSAIKQPSIDANGGEDKDSTSGLNRLLYCGSCSQGFETIGKLHDHLINHDSNGSYYYDNLLRTAFPKYGTVCSGTQTEYEFVNVTQKKGDAVTTHMTDNFDVPIRRDVLANVASNIRNRSLESEKVYESSIITTNAPKNAGECKIKINLKSQDSKNLNKISMNDDIPASTKIQTSSMDLQHEVYRNELPNLSPNKHIIDEGERNGDMHLYTDYSENCIENPQCDVGNRSAPDDQYESIECNASEMQEKTKRVEKAKPKRESNRRKSKIGYKFEAVECHICKKRVRSKYYLYTHLKLHDGKKCRCEKCGEMFVVSIYKKQKHKCVLDVERSEGECGLSCVLCKKTLTTKRRLTRHMNTMHPECGHSCALCKKTFKRKDSVQNHIKTVHSTCGHSCTCALCKKTFKSKIYLTNHMNQVHSNTRPFVCEVCGSGFKRSSSLKIHLSVHDTVRTRYPCSQCDMTFSFNGALQRHMKGHKGQMNEQCSVCGKILIGTWNLKAHMRQHTGDKPYTCDRCGLGFTHNVSRKNHMAKHHGIPRT